MKINSNEPENSVEPSNPENNQSRPAKINAQLNLFYHFEDNFEDENSNTNPASNNKTFKRKKLE